MTECKSLHDSEPPSDAIAPYHGQSFPAKGFLSLPLHLMEAAFACTR